MKKILLLSALLTSVAGASAWNVSTEPSMQSSVIEEFTGIYCGNCPDGHRRVAALSKIHPSDVFTIAIHAGDFAKPNTGAPDYRTEIGNAIHNHFSSAIFGYPSGTTSRQDVGFKMVQSRVDWNKSSRIICNTPSPVNVWAASAYDADTQQLTVDVEAYLVENMEDPRLNVFILQNNLMGYQSGSTVSPYPHRHMLRVRLTENDFGDPLDVKDAGNYYSKTFTYTVPNDINGIRMLPQNLEIIAFISDGEDNIRKAATTYPVITGQDTPFTVFTSEPLITVGTTYALDYLEMYIENYSAEDITTATFDVTLNGETNTVTWNGMAPAHENTLIRVPLSGALKSTYANTNNRFSMTMISANTHTDLGLAPVKGSFGALPEIASDLKVRIYTDENFAENRFRLIDEDGNTVKEFGPYDQMSRFEEEIALEDGKVYGLEVTDAWGDGLSSDGVQLIDPAGHLACRMDNIPEYGTRYFFRASKALSIDRVNGEAEILSTEYFDMAGRRVLNPSNGIYMKRVTYTDGMVNIFKEIIK